VRVSSGVDGGGFMGASMFPQRVERFYADALTNVQLRKRARSDTIRQHQRRDQIRARVEQFFPIDPRFPQQTGLNHLQADETSVECTPFPEVRNDIP
jgi:hypothetical protein